MDKIVEKQMRGQGVPVVHRYPEVRSGTCEWCGVIDQTKPADIQYTLCPHYKGVNLQCTYCDASRNPLEVNRMAVLNVYDHPTNPNALIVVCDRTDCVEKHRKRFNVA